MGFFCSSEYIFDLEILMKNLHLKGGKKTNTNTKTHTQKTKVLCMFRMKPQPDRTRDMRQLSI